MNTRYLSYVLLLLLLGFGSARPESRANPVARVVGGSATSIEKYPFMVTLRISSGWFFCGGTIVSAKFVLTTAYCVHSEHPSDISVQYGVTIICITDHNTVKVQRIIKHELYKHLEARNDIALVQVAQSFQFNYVTVAPVRLPPMNFATPQDQSGGVPATLLGWGLNASQGVQQNTLQEVQLTIISDRECILRHDGFTHPIYNICAEENGKGQCDGDLGDPLMYNGMQLGIVSWSYAPCAETNVPGVYTRVASYIDWIINKQILYD